jgi:hypothetical protein
MARAKSAKRSNDTSANIGFEAKLWLAADKLRSNTQSAMQSATASHNGKISLSGLRILMLIDSFPP